ncbi:MAG: ribosome assembly factor SBDS [archaeon]
MKPIKSYDQERVHLNLAKLKKAGEHFEVVIDPDKILDYKQKKIDLKELLLYEKVFADAKKGLEASDELIKNVFGTDDPLAIAKIIVTEGEIQFTQEYREQKRKEKLNKIIDVIARNAVDPRSGLPHPRVRIEAAMEEAKIKVDDQKDAEDQISEIVHKLKPILPIKFALKEIEVRIVPQYAAKAYSTVERFGKLLQSDWLTDGSWMCVVEIPAGIQNDLFDALNKLTHGSVESKILREK